MSSPFYLCFTLRDTDKPFPKSKSKSTHTLSNMATLREMRDKKNKICYLFFKIFLK